MPACQFTCDDCGKRFTRLSNLHRHQRTTHGSNSFRCQTCEKGFNRRDNYVRHMRNHPEISDRESQESEMINNSWNLEITDKENACPNQVGSGNDTKGSVISFVVVVVYF